MTQQEKLIAKYGNPMLDTRVFEARSMTLWVPSVWISTHIPAIPNKIYCNKDLVKPLESTLLELISLGLAKEIKTWDGCYNVRMVRGSKTVMSIHSFGLAVDLNASHNPLGLSKRECKERGLTPFTDAFDMVWYGHGWTLGIDFKRADGMHREYVKL